MMKVHSCLVQRRLVIPHKSRVPQNLMKIPQKLCLLEIVGPDSKLCICKVHTRVWTLQIQSFELGPTISERHNFFSLNFEVHGFCVVLPNGIGQDRNALSSYSEVSNKHAACFFISHVLLQN